MHHLVCYIDCSSIICNPTYRYSFWIFFILFNSATPSSFLSAPSYDVFSPLFHHANPKPAHFNTINAAAQHRQQVLAAQAAVTKQTADSDIIRENYTQHHSSISTPQTGSYFDQSSGSAVAAALGWQARGGQSDFTLRNQGELNSNNQLPSAFGILPHENVASSPAPTPAKHSTSSGGSTGVYDSFNAHFPQVCNTTTCNSIIYFVNLNVASVFQRLSTERINSQKKCFSH